jgi:hypothetical protein
MSPQIDPNEEIDKLNLPIRGIQVGMVSRRIYLS